MTEGSGKKREWGQKIEIACIAGGLVSTLELDHGFGSVLSSYHSKGNHGQMRSSRAFGIPYATCSGKAQGPRDTGSKWAMRPAVHRLHKHSCSSHLLVCGPVVLLFSYQLHRTMHSLQTYYQ